MLKSTKDDRKGVNAYCFVYSARNQLLIPISKMFNFRVAVALNLQLALKPICWLCCLSPPNEYLSFVRPPSSIVFTPPHTEQLAPHQNPNLWCDSSNATASVFFFLDCPLLAFWMSLIVADLSVLFMYMQHNPLKVKWAIGKVEREREKKIETETENEPPPPFAR